VLWKQCIFMKKSTYWKPDMVFPAYSLSTWEAKAGGLWVPGLYINILFQKKAKTQKKYKWPVNTWRNAQPLQIKMTLRFHLTPVRMAVIKNIATNAGEDVCVWRGEGTLMRCWWKWKLVQSLWKALWRFFK
jgi:hypothetical protein